MTHFDITPDNERAVLRHLVSFVTDADPAAFELGRHWYDEANAAARALGRDLGVTPRQAAGAIAALSPGLEAGVNLTSVVDILEHRGSRTNGQIAKARACLLGDPAEVLDPITGPKTWNFFWNIYAPGLRDHVTVDGRYADIVANEMRPWMVNRGIDRGGYGTRYDRHLLVTEDVASCLRRRGRNVNAAQVQAIAWCEAKRIELSAPHCQGKVRKQGPWRKGQPYV